MSPNRYEPLAATNARERNSWRDGVGADVTAGGAGVAVPATVAMHRKSSASAASSWVGTKPGNASSIPKEVSAAPATRRPGLSVRAENVLKVLAAEVMEKIRREEVGLHPVNFENSTSIISRPPGTAVLKPPRKLSDGLNHKASLSSRRLRRQIIIGDVTGYYCEIFEGGIYKRGNCGIAGEIATSKEHANSRPISGPFS